MRNHVVRSSLWKTSTRVLAIFAAAALLSGCSSSMDRFMSWRKNTSDSDPVYTAAIPKKKSLLTPRSQSADDQIASAPIRKPSWKLNGKGTGNEYASLRKNKNLFDRDQSVDVTDSPAAASAENDPSPQIKAVGGKIRIERGMTMYSIASANGLSIRQLARANGIRAPYMIREGQILRMPLGVASVKVPRTTLANQKQQIDNDVASGVDQPVKLQLPKSKNFAARDVQVEEVKTIGKSGVKIGSKAFDGSPQLDDVPEIPKSGEPVPIAGNDAGDASTVTIDNGTGVNGLRWPVKGKVIAEFGKKPDGAKNEGINIAVPEGTMIKAAGDGVIAYAGNGLKGYGNLVLIRHEGGFVTAYAHAKDLSVKKGDSVKRGAIIGRTGQTGAVNSPQLHFEVRKGPTALDPLKYLGNATAQN
jgi:murein DD-endopeptidase MepM/ murein hydrolase activator NlpD